MYFTPEPKLCPPEDTRAVCCSCACCGEPIREGDEYWKIMGRFYCESCIDDAHHYDAEIGWMEEY